MFCTARFYVDGKDYPLLRCQVHLPQRPINKSGMVTGNAPAPQIHLALESTSETHLLCWINEQQIKENVQVRFINHHRIGADKVFDLYDVTCIRNEEFFWKDGSRPMTNTITLVPAILFYNGAGPIVLPWHIQDPASLNGSGAAATERPVAVSEDKVFCISALYWTDRNGNKLDGPQLGKNILVVHSENSVGKVVSFNLTDVNYDFKYQGVELDNDQLKDYTIQADMDKIEIEAY